MLKNNILVRYANWLQKDTPTGTVETYPEISSQGETSLKGVFIVGDLTGVPLLKLASEGGDACVSSFLQDAEFNKQQEKKSKKALDVAIVGAGPAGIAAALRCKKSNLSYRVFEAGQVFNTIKNFPTAKPIIANPAELQQCSSLKVQDGTKETLLADMHEQIKNEDLAIQTATSVSAITTSGDELLLETSEGTTHALRVVLAIGKSGNARRLGVQGEELSKVFDSLRDAKSFNAQNIVVVGGGDSALEASIALAQAGNQVSHSYRKDSFSRPKEKNAEAFSSLVTSGAITPFFNSQVKKITEDEVYLSTAQGEQRIKNNAVFSLIGRELPLSFFKRCGIKMEGERDISWYVYLITMLSFFTMLYFGKSGFATPLFADAHTPVTWLQAYLLKPFTLSSNWTLQGYGWYSPLNFYVGWLGSIIWCLSAPLALWCMVKRFSYYFGTTWHRIKYGYLIAVSLLYTWVYFSQLLMREGGWVEEPTFWYSALYCSTMTLFGIRRAIIKPTTSIRLQMLSLISIQIFFLFLLPFYLYDSVIAANFAPDSWVIQELFPAGKWQSFGFILFWPLNISSFGSSTFWTWFPFVQTGFILFFLVRQYGKGAYCGWICSCGGMAETLGDEYRTMAPHGPTAKKWELLGQFTLFFITIATIVHYLATHTSLGVGLANDILWGIYKVSIDIFFAGVLGLGVYFFMGGRIWCRFGCPLAALMHIYARFSKYRIFSDKNKCISCNGCTKVCHMGIDVMGYASKGLPMNDVQCVRCSSCIDHCPTDVLHFGKIET